MIGASVGGVVCDLSGLVVVDIKPAAPLVGMAGAVVSRRQVLSWQREMCPRHVWVSSIS